MKKRWFTFLLMLICLLATAGCGETSRPADLSEPIGGMLSFDDKTTVAKPFPADTPSSEQAIIVTTSNASDTEWEARVVVANQLEELEWIEVELIALYGAETVDRKTIVSAIAQARDHLKGKATFSLRTYDLSTGYILRLTGDEGTVGVYAESIVSWN